MPLAIGWFDGHDGFHCTVCFLRLVIDVSNTEVLQLRNKKFRKTWMRKELFRFLDSQCVLNTGIYLADSQYNVCDDTVFGPTGWEVCAEMNLYRSRDIQTSDTWYYRAMRH